MGQAIEILCYGIALPGAIALTIVWLCQHFRARSTLAKRAAGFAVAAAFFLGCALTFGRAAFVPARYWQWLPYAAAMAGGIAIAVPDRFHAAIFRWIWFAALALIAAWLIVPTRPTLSPPRPISIALLATYLFLLMVSLSHLPERLQGTLFTGELAVAAAVVAALLAAEISFTYGQIGIVAGASLGGAAVAMLASKSPIPASPAIPVYAIMSGSLAYIGCISREPAWPAILLAAAAPLGLWICAAAPLARLRGTAGGTIQIVAVIVPLTIAVLWTLLTGEPGEY